MTAEQTRIAGLAIAFIVGGGILWASIETAHLAHKTRHVETSAEIEAKEDFRKLKEKVFRHLHEAEPSSR